MYVLDDKLNKMDQYIRKDNITLSGIPEHVDQEAIEGKVIEILEKIDTNVEPSDIIACHRLVKNKNEKKKKEPAKGYSSLW